MAPASLDYPDRDFNIQAPVNQIHSQYSSPATYVSGPAVPQAPWQDQFLNHPQTYATCLVPTSGPSSTPLQDLNVPIGPQEQETNDPIYSFGLPPFHSILLPPPSYENPFRNELEVKFDASNAPASFPTPSNEQTEERFPHADTSLKPLAHPKKSKAEPPQVVPADNQLIVNVVCPFPTCSSRTFAKDDASMHVRIYHTTLCNPKGKRISCPVPDCGRTSKGLTLKSESYARHFTTHFEGDPCPFGCGTKLKRLKPHLADRHKKSCKIFRDGAQAAAQGTQGEAAPAGEPAQAGPSNERLMPGQWPQDRPTVSNSRTRAAATAETQAVAGPHAGMHVFQAGPQPLPSAPAPRRGRPKANTSRPGPSEASTSQAGSSYASPSNSTPAYGIDPEQVVSAFARELPEEYAWVAPHELQPYPEQADHDSHPGPAFAGAAQLPPAGALSYEPYCYSAPPGFDALAMPPSGGSGLPAILEERFGPLESPTLGPRVPDLFDIAPFMVDGAYQEDPSRYKDKSSARHLPTFPPTPSAGAWTSTESYTQLGFRRSARILSRSNSAAEAATAPSGMADGTARSSEPAAVQTAGERRRKRQRGDHAEAPSGKKERRG
ncbi:hypothetical protein PsYK624_051900 [Phanerochaete sordida]|uniref:Uncharacterized protein n=1 Tax=Phanerochaete sordida TaxID=48140 RepID=A0A9P3LCE9_9APHY|nr:hypothetical protein PsYK624_051900 [Phanerochaete sordida]